MPTTVGGSQNSKTDYVSAVCFLIAAVVSLVTLVTVYAAVLQLLSRRQQYELGLSERYLGRWSERVTSPPPPPPPSQFRILDYFNYCLKSIKPKMLQVQIYTPTINLPNSTTRQDDPWRPNFTLPTGSRDDKQPDIGPDIEAGKVLAETGWANFFQALGFDPQDKGLYEMQTEPELVNGVIPMRWKGRDLVAICSILGFQAGEKDPDYRTPMILPMQWSGPLGLLQFRASSDSCIVEYRASSNCQNQLPKSLRTFYKGQRPANLA